MTDTSILLVTSDQEAIDSFRRCVVPAHIRLAVAGAMSEVAERLFSRNVDMLFVQTDEAGGSLVPTLSDVLLSEPSLPIVAVSRVGTIGDAVRAMRAGASDYVTTPLDSPKVLTQIVERVRAEQKSAPGSASAPSGFNGFFAADQAMLDVCRMIVRVAPLSAPAVIVGESGAGKSYLARKLHEFSPRCGFRFVKVFCAPFDRSGLRRELFGEKAQGPRNGHPRGKARLAEGGTLLLHRPGAGASQTIAELLEPNAMERPARDVRLVLTCASRASSAACRRLVKSCARIGRAPLVIQVPPLKARVADIPLLAMYFARRFSRKHGRQPKELSPEAMECLARHAWPGNVRELENAIEHGVMLSCNNVIGLHDLPESVLAGAGQARRAKVPGLPLKQALQESEKAFLIRALETAGWNKKQVAKALRISRSTLYAKIRQHRLGAEPVSWGGPV